MTSILDSTATISDAGSIAGKPSLGKKLQWLLEWEKAYLQEQVPQDGRRQGQAADDIALDCTKHSVGREVGLVVQGIQRGNNIHQTTAQTPGTQLSVEPAVLVEQSWGASARHESRIVLPQLSAAKADVTQLTQRRHMPAPLPAADSPVYRAVKKELPSFLVTKQGDDASVWIRQQGITARSGGELVMKLRQTLMQMGVRLARLTVNGERVFGNEYTGQAKLSSDDDAGLNGLNKHI